MESIVTNPEAGRIVTPDASLRCREERILGVEGAAKRGFLKTLGRGVGAGAIYAGTAGLVTHMDPGTAMAEEMSEEECKEMAIRIMKMSKQQRERFVAQLPSTKLGSVRDSKLAEFLFYGSRGGLVRDLDLPAEAHGFGKDGKAGVDGMRYYIFGGGTINSTDRPYAQGRIFGITTSELFKKINPENDVIFSGYFGNDIQEAVDHMEKARLVGTTNVASK